ncbi:MAG TPA: 3-dehydroquinate synthase [Clostridiaceae bacterium]|nr:3-dehydroquinate synthase [Clostridiaceae bacterium]
MRTISIKTQQREYDVTIGVGALAELGAIAAATTTGRKAIIVSDDIVGPLYIPQLNKTLREAGFKAFSYTHVSGEAHKNIHMLQRLYNIFAQLELTRTDLIIALGGGVIGDVAGFAAATYQRGIPYIQVPTSLLAQVDASVGGKTAIDMPFGKNMVGAFYQPWAVVIDPAVLATLPVPRISEGMAEVIKYGCIKDEGILEQVQTRDFQTTAIIARCVEIKAAVVAADEFDKGERMLLNFGHTLGHAIEKATHYSLYTHGAAVACGMVAAIRIGIQLGITPPTLETALKSLLEFWQLPTAAAISKEEVLATVRKDKKWLSGTLNFILLEEFGRAIIRPMQLEELTELVEITWLEAGVNG